MIREIKRYVKKTSRIYLSGSSDTKRWMVLHGYAQLAREFIITFDNLKLKDQGIIAPEGLSRFYVRGTGGPVGATWMTSESRETDIEDIHHQLDHVYNEFLSGQFQGAFNLLGFSQGVTTAVRWFMHAKPPVKKMILWAGHMPIELNIEEFALAMRNTQLFIVYGLQDKYLSDIYLENIKMINEAVKGSHILTFSGEHKLDPDILKRIMT